MFPAAVVAVAVKSMRSDPDTWLEAGATGAPHVSPEGEEQLDPVNVLIVDDRPEDLLALSVVLDAPGYRVVQARSGTEALRQLLRQDFAAILLDIVMPGMDGFEVATLIKQRDRSRLTPILFMSAEGEDVGRAYRAYSIGAIDCLSKPIDVEVVRAKVGVFVDLYRKGLRLERQARALRDADRRERAVQLAELELAAARRYENLAEAIPHVVLTATPDGGLDYANRHWVEYTGIPLAKAKGDGWLDALHPEDAERCQRGLRAALERGEPWVSECRLRRASDGGYRFHLCRAVPERDADGNVLAWLGTLTDVEELKHALSARDEFMAIASHELRTPLTALKLRVQSLQRAHRGEADLSAKLGGAMRQTERLERLIDNLLDVSRVATGHLDIEPEEFEFAVSVRDVVERFSPDAERAGVRFELDLSPDSQGRWDRMRVEQVLTNLLSNALKYGDGPRVRIVVGTDESTIRLAVESRAVIPGGQLERIFDRFERAGGQRSAGGLGVGLYVTRQIVEAHGGTIRARSREGEGTTLVVDLPRRCFGPDDGPHPATGEDGNGVA